MPKIRRSNAEWAELIKDCKSCGLSDREWMKQHHISPSSFYKKLHELYGDISNALVVKVDVSKFEKIIVTVSAPTKALTA